MFPGIPDLLLFMLCLVVRFIKYHSTLWSFAERNDVPYCNTGDGSMCSAFIRFLVGTQRTVLCVLLFHIRHGGIHCQRQAHALLVLADGGGVFLQLEVVPGSVPVLVNVAITQNI